MSESEFVSPTVPPIKTNPNPADKIGKSRKLSIIN